MKKPNYFFTSFLVVLICSSSLFSQVVRVEQDTSEAHFTRSVRFTDNTPIISLGSNSDFRELLTLVQNNGSEINCNAISELGGTYLEEINLIISLVNNHSANSSKIYFNKYFSNHPNLSHFRKYFSSIPSNSNLTNNQYAGHTARRQDLFSNLIFQLIEISCSSKYGGSIEYTFDLMESDEYEFRSLNHLYDFSKFNFRIYITPNNQGINFPNQITNSLTRIEYDLETRAIYNINGDNLGRAATIIDESEREQSLNELKAAFKSPLQLVLNSIKTDLARFTGGLIRSINGPIFEQPNIIIDHVQLSDNNITLKTHNGMKFAYVSMKIMGIDVDTEIGEEEFKLYVYNFKPGIYKSLASFEGLDQREGTGWFSLDRFPVTTSCGNKSYKINYSLKEEDGGLNFDDRFDVDSHVITIACASLVNKPVYTIVDSGHVSNILVRNRENHEIEGTMHIAYKVFLTMQ